MAKKWSFWLEELGQQHHDLVGRKCANLGEMTRMGLPVPDGFALSTEAYTDFLNISGAAEEIQSRIQAYRSQAKEPGKFNELSARICQILNSKPLPRDMEETILNYYRELCQRSGGSKSAVSVRSSGPISHPGQYETYLNVADDSAVLTHVKKVWSSTFNTRSLAFRSQKGMALETDPIGIAVLKMVSARAAGVIFTADPNTGETSRMILEANWGLGESVVGGEAMPDVFVVNKATLVIEEKRLGLKSRCVLPDAVGTAVTATPPEKSAIYCLSEPEVKIIAALAKKLEDHFGVPQDIEWAIDQDVTSPPKVVLLQTRPEVMTPKKSPIDQIADLMLERFSGGTKFGDGL